jgi:xeroderma pigmentosum group C-complementing protein
MVLRAKGIRARGRAGRAGGGRGVARPQKQDDGIQSVYKEMLRDDAGDTAASTVDDGSRPRKRPRRAGERMQRAPETEETRQRLAQPIVEVESSPPPPQKPQQIIVDDSESDLEFEDIEFGGNSTADDDEALPEPMKGHEEGFSVLVKQAGQNTPARAERKRRQVTWAGREVRLAIHKVHILYLLYHVFYRNHWCSDDVVRVRIYTSNKSYMQ